MTWSRYLTAIRPSMQRSGRTGRIQYVILHHGATTSDEVMIQMMVSGSRQVSATAVVKDGRRTGVVDEDYRPWTTAAAAWDGHACTIECANESTVGWTISDESYHSMAILLADWSTRYGFPLVRNGRNSTVFGHREIYAYFGDSYATACPGGMDVDRVVAEANAIKAGTAGGGSTPIPIGDDDMPVLELMQTPDGTVWYCVNRLHRYGIPNEQSLASYEAFIKKYGAPGSNANIVKQANGNAWGSPVFVGGTPAQGGYVSSTTAPK